ncbi:methylenetetrahydrofolate--tRNA-(uracil(54)-C(5))-methyltransferase (FADH(2)-oxidizing) TrmFO [Acetonema longum]|uniref:Methylenetetrahydrofolate--tRNA-(uracil-5-)-methyltransferase TrmFO n=1 Tax=Acetonema longum DSM 6540 TaxID=1009370 RepID=F7NL32_9FIRM|nr:methylenetetrahydrofolate--tRNA-(uracil(54)-C(5))-methyltransferase (FADH(2)-oxidizing) TrmFO [Acetonema longum]EGO63137.1 gid protein [Acetonema longum DSM 6540]
MSNIAIIGAGLAGCEAAWQLVKRGIPVDLFEMRPASMTPTHKTGMFAELVCSNSLRAAALENAVGLLKEEMRQLESFIMKAADKCRLPAGGALAVDRDGFSSYITETLGNHPLIQVHCQELKTIPLNEYEVIIVATGPLTSPGLSEHIQALTGDQFYFYDAAAPVIAADSLDMNIIYRASRYDKGDDDYLNCPMDKPTYEIFWRELINADATPIKEFEKAIFFEGCMPIEVMAARGIDTMRFGPLKPVGLVNPQTTEIPYAVVQLRQDNAAATLYNMVGFQTHLKWPEQKRVFQLIPGLQNAEFVRLGVMHRNTYINSPLHLLPTLQMRNLARTFFAGQITGVEGYVESAATGLLAGMNAARLAAGKEPLIFPQSTAHGALVHYITHADVKNFQPMNINFGLMPPLEHKIKDKKKKNLAIATRALTDLTQFIEKCDNCIA